MILLIKIWPWWSSVTIRHCITFLPSWSLLRIGYSYHSNICMFTLDWVSLSAYTFFAFRNDIYVFLRTFLSRLFFSIYWFCFSPSMPFFSIFLNEWGYLRRAGSHVIDVGIAFYMLWIYIIDCQDNFHFFIFQMRFIWPYRLT